MKNLPICNKFCFDGFIYYEMDYSFWDPIVWSRDPAVEPKNSLQNQSDFICKSGVRNLGTYTNSYYYAHLV